MTHSEMIKEISGQYGGHMLIKMLDHYHVDGLRELTESQIESFYQSANCKSVNCQKFGGSNDKRDT